MLPFFNGPPPSKLGFTAKAELPAHINILFRARPPLDHLETEDKEHRPKYDLIHDGNHDLDQIFEEGPPPERILGETPAQRKERIWKERIIANYLKIKDERKKYDPASYENITGDPYNTLFVSRLSFKTDEEALTKELERFGPVKTLRLVRNQKTGKSRGYAFAEFKHGRHAQRFYDASGMKIDGKRILVDYECGRTDKEWLPKRLGGGKGEKRRDREVERRIRKIIKEYKREKERSASKDKSSKKRNKTEEEDSKHKRVKVNESEEVHKTEEKSDVKKGESGKQEEKTNVEPKNQEVKEVKETVKLQEEIKEQVKLQVEVKEPAKPQEEVKHEIPKSDFKHTDNVVEHKTPETSGKKEEVRRAVPIELKSAPAPAPVQNNEINEVKPTKRDEKAAEKQEEQKLDLVKPEIISNPKDKLSSSKDIEMKDDKRSSKDIEKPRDRDSRHKESSHSREHRSHKTSRESSRKHKDSHRDSSVKHKSRDRSSSREHSSSKHKSSKDRHKDRKDKKDKKDRKKDKKDKRSKKHSRKHSRDNTDKEDGEFSDSKDVKM